MTKHKERGYGNHQYSNILTPFGIFVRKGKLGLLTAAKLIGFHSRYHPNISATEANNFRGQVLHTLGLRE